jgi:hypothetical protein
MLSVRQRHHIVPGCAGILKMIGPSSKTWILAVWAAGTFAVLTAVALFPV